MAADPGVIVQLGFREAGTGTVLTVAQGLFNNPTGGPEPDQLPTAGGDVDVKDRHSFTTRVYQWSHFAQLNTWLVARKQIEVTHFHAAATTDDVYTPCNFSLQPVFPIADFCQAYIGAVGAAGNPTTDPLDWTDLGAFIGTPTLNVPASRPADGCGDPYFHSVGIEFVGLLLNTPATSVNTTLNSFNRGPCRFAIRHSDDSFLIFEGLTVTKQYAPEYSDTGFRAYRVRLTGRAGDITTLLTFPTTPPNFFYSFDLAYAASGVTEADYLSQV